MKFLRFLFMSCLLVACTQVSMDEEQDSPVLVVNALTTDNPLSDRQGSGTVEFYTNVAWRAESDQEWCHVSPAYGDAGICVLEVTADDNDTHLERAAVVTVSYAQYEETFVVKQKQKDAILLSSDRYEVGYEGGEICIEVEANVEVEVGFEDGSDEWIHVVQTKSMDSSSYILNVDENTSDVKREGRVVFFNGDVSETVVVYQEARLPSIVLTQNEYVIPSAGETIKVEIRTNTDYTIIMPDVKWVKEVTTKAMSTYTHFFEISSNTDYDSREAVVTVRDNDSGLEEDITIIQLQANAILLAKSEYEMPWQGGELSMEVNSNVTLNVDVSVDWIEIVTTKGLEQHTLYFSIKENTGDEAREGTITISSGDIEQTVKVTQGNKPFIKVTPNEFNVPSAGKTIVLTIDSNVPYDITYPVGDWWIIQSPESTYGQKAYEVLENDTYEPRESTLKIYNDEYGLCEEVNVFQAQKDAVIVAQNEYEFTSDATELSFEVQHNVEFEVQISGDWITPVQTRALSSTVLTFAIAENTSNVSRQASITVNAEKVSQTVYVAQQAYNADREILVNLYNSTAGHLWENNDNWCTDLPLGQWYGVTTDHNGRVTALELGKGLSGDVILSGMTKLQSLYIGNNDCTGLELANCPALTNLSTFGNHFTSLDLSGCPSISSVSLSGYAEYGTWTGSGWALSGYENLPLKELNLKGCDNLHTLSLEFTSMPELEVADLEGLYALYCTNNEFMTSLSVTRLPSLGELQCFGNDLESLEINDCPYIDRLWCGDNRIESLDLSRLLYLRDLGCASNKLTRLDFADNISLGGVVCSDNPLTELNIGTRESLDLLLCDNCNLEFLELSDIFVSVFSCRDCKLKELTLNNVSGDDLYCSGNELETLDASGFKLVDCSDNKLIELKTGLSLYELDCHNNLLTELKFSDIILAYLNCSYNKLRSLDVMNVKGFDIGLNCSYNELKSVAFYAALGFNGIGNQIEEITTSDYMMSWIGTEYFLFESWGRCDGLTYLPPTHQFSYEYPKFTVL